MLAYKPDLDPTFFTTRFIEGLARDIRAVVMIQRPNDLETAVSLALLQEEIEDDEPKLPNKTMASRPMHKPFSSGANFTRHNQVSDNPSAHTVSNNLSTLKAYRKARGLCFTCGEKFVPGHKCSTTVKLHVVEELLAFIHTPEPASDQSPAETEQFEDALADTTEVCCSISKHAVTGTEQAHSMRLLGQIQGLDALILIDSRSSNNFVSSAFAAKLQGLKTLDTPVKVKVAGGGILTGGAEILDCTWTCQVNSFNTTLKVLPLHCYDVILGMPWLEEFGLMQTHWAQKWFQFEWEGKQCRLNGLTANTSQCAVISEAKLQQLHEQDSVYHLLQVFFTTDAKTQKTVPHIIGMVLDAHSQVFDEPKGLPPHRKYDHTIPLMPGASPVNLRPYRYSPLQKNEIKKQVKELLAQGVIQASSSPFASPTLLVGKKDLTWRLCVDYRHLNALTIKNKYPLPVIDEFLDELAGAKWFTRLDLRAGYHQIRMDAGEEYKTAFQTHHGHFDTKLCPMESLEALLHSKVSRMTS